MRPAYLLVIGIFLSIGCADAHTVTLQSDDGARAVAYRCGGWSSQIGSVENRTVIADYTLRLARAAAAGGDTSALRQLMSPYESEDWATLEAVAVEHACTNAALAADPPSFPEPGTVPPDFRLLRIDGGDSVTLSALRGRVVVVDFWATWCAPCVKQLPELVSIAAAHPERVVVLGITYKDAPRSVLSWLSENETDPVIHLVDPGEKVARAYRVNGIPAGFIIGPDGTMMRSSENPRLRAGIDELRRQLESN